MGIYFNPDNIAFRESVNKTIYVDKSMLIDYVTKYSIKVNKNICVSRPRRFGKSTDASHLYHHALNMQPESNSEKQAYNFIKGNYSILDEKK